MKNLFEARTAEEVKARLARLRPESPRLWGTMDAAQAVAHCAVSLETAVGDKNPPRLFIGRLIGRAVKRLALRNEAPFKRNSPTDPAFVMRGAHVLDAERTRLGALIDRFVQAGPEGCTRHPHSFFGPLTPQEWAVLMHKHLDHHLRQFGV